MPPIAVIPELATLHQFGVIDLQCLKSSWWIKGLSYVWQIQRQIYRPQAIRILSDWDVTAVVVCWHLCWPRCLLQTARKQCQLILLRLKNGWSITACHCRQVRIWFHFLLHRKACNPISLLYDVKDLKFSVFLLVHTSFGQFDGCIFQVVQKRILSILFKFVCLEMFIKWFKGLFDSWSLFESQIGIIILAKLFYLSTYWVIFPFYIHNIIFFNYFLSLCFFFSFAHFLFIFFPDQIL